MSDPLGCLVAQFAAAVVARLFRDARPEKQRKWGSIGCMTRWRSLKFQLVKHIKVKFFDDLPFLMVGKNEAESPNGGETCY